MPYAENSGTGLEVKTENQLADMTGILGSAFVKSDKFPVLAWEVNGSDDIDTSTKPTPSVTPASTPKIEEKIPSYIHHKENGQTVWLKHLTAETEVKKIRML